jgi:hypothetical protein
MRRSAESIFENEYESIFETASACEPKDTGVLFAEKNRGTKISYLCPFKWVLKCPNF